MLKCNHLLAVVCMTIKIITTKELTSQYEGQLFPRNYLDAESVVSSTTTVHDMEHYLNHLKVSIAYFAMYPNTTDSNTALCLYFTKSILKRTVYDYRNKMQPDHLKDVLKAINDAEHLLSHYIYLNSWYGWNDLQFRVSKLFQYDASLIYSMGKFNNERLKQWILNTENVNDFMEDIDAATLPRDAYVELCDPGREGYYIHILDSDTCLSRVAFNPEPIDIDISTTHPCKPDAFCERSLFSEPSFGYTLSHRLLNIMFRMNVKRCYLVSEKQDLALIDQLCAAMYRETVYLARKGFFARDMFLEHIALCATMGYQEFHRRSWFYKATSWINDPGCLKEFRNFDLNLTSLMIKQAGDDSQRRSYLKRWRCESMHSICDNHPSAIFMIVMSHAIRHAAHIMIPSFLNSTENRCSR